MQGSPELSKDPATADPTNARVLKEYRFSDFASSTYTRDDGRTLRIRAARFADASGAFGAYTFYLQPAMNKEQIGDQGASLGQRVLFYRGHVLLDAQFSKESAMSGAELRELAGALPRPNGNSGGRLACKLMGCFDAPQVLSCELWRGIVNQHQRRFATRCAVVRKRHF